MLATGLSAGLAPALESLRVDLTGALKGYLGDGRPGARFSIRNLLVGIQVALGLALLVCAGLLASVGLRPYSDSSFDMSRILVAPIHFPAGATEAASRTMYRNVEQRLLAIPGVRSVAYSAGRAVSRLPATAHSSRHGGRAERNGESGIARVSGSARHPSPCKGATFRRATELREPSARGAVVSQSFAHRFLGGKYPVGLRFEPSAALALDIVGVAKDVEAGSDSRVAVYVYGEWNRRGTNLIVRTAGDPRAAAQAIRDTVRNAYPDVLVTPRTLLALSAEDHQVQRRLLLLFLASAGIAVLLAIAGSYGVVAFSVSRRTRELGIRVALGAQPAQVLRAVLISGMRPVMYGLFAGIWLALLAETAVRQFFSGQRVQFDTGNPIVYLACVLVLGGVAAIAMLRPANRAAKADPMEALRYD